MKAKRLIIVSAVALVVTVLTVTGSMKSNNALVAHLPAEAWQTAQVDPSKLSQRVPDPVGTVDGAKTPELIPDQTAYLMLFRLISGHQSQLEKSKIRAYVRQMGLGDQRCRYCSYSAGDQDADIDALISAADEFRQGESLLDNQAHEIKNRSWPNPSTADLNELDRLEHVKERLVNAMVSSLASRLSPRGYQSARQYINEHVKRRIKVIPNLTTFPGGEGWQQGLPPDLAPGAPRQHHQD